MQIYWVLFREDGNTLEKLYDYQKWWYETKLDVPVESEITTIRRYRHPFCGINWDKEVRTPALHPRRIV